MVLRYTRSCVLLFLVVAFIYFTSVYQDEANHPQWAKSVMQGSWMQDWVTYDLMLLKQEVYGVSADDPKLFAAAPKFIANATNTTRAAASPSPSPAIDSKLRLPALFSGPSPYAYVFPITGDELACAALINIDRLANAFHTRHRIIALVQGNISREYAYALNKSNVTVREVEPLLQQGATDGEHSGLLKLRAFWLHEADNTLKRILIVDPDVLILRSLDSVFDLPAVDLAAPRAYWSDTPSVSAAFMLVSLSDRARERVEAVLQKSNERTSVESVVNHAFGTVALVLPGSYDTQTDHWDKWTMPEWFRAEEVSEMEEAGHFTGSHGLVKQAIPADIAALGWAVARWRSDYEVENEHEELENGDEVQPDDADESASDNDEEDTERPDQAESSDDDPSRPTERRRVKRTPDGPDEERARTALMEAQKAAALKAQIEADAERPAETAQHEDRQGAASADASHTETAGTSADTPAADPEDKGAPEPEQGRDTAAVPTEELQKDEASHAATTSTSAAQGAQAEPATSPTENAATSDEEGAAMSDATTEGDKQPDPTQYHSDMPLPTPVEPLSTTSTTTEPEPTPTVIDKAALKQPLLNLHRVAHVLRFREGEKPWQRRAEEFAKGHEEAHELWLEHFKQWRQMAKRICPAVNRTHVDDQDGGWKEEKLVQDV